MNKSLKTIRRYFFLKVILKLFIFEDTETNSDNRKIMTFM